MTNYRCSKTARIPQFLPDLDDERNSLLKVTNQADGSKNVDFYLINTIEDIEDYIDFLRALEDCHPIDSVDVHINCFGGALYAGYQLYDALCKCPAEINMHIEGFAASAASMIMMAGDNFDFSPHASIMVHAMSSCMYGKWQEIMSQIEFDKKWFEESAKEIYEGFLSEDEIKRMLKGEDFWFTAKEAADRIKDARKDELAKQMLVAEIAEKHQAAINAEIKEIMEGKKKTPVKKAQVKKTSKPAKKAAEEKNK